MNDLQDHDVIKALHRETSVTLEDLTEGRLYIEPPEKQGEHIEPGSWFLCYAEGLPPADIERLRSARQSQPRLVRAAALVVASAQGRLSKQQQYATFDYARYVIAHEYELAQLLRRSEGGKATAELRTNEAGERMAEAVSYWRKFEAEGRPERERCGIIATRMKAKPDTVRDWIRKAGLR